MNIIRSKSKRSPEVKNVSRRVAGIMERLETADYVTAERLEKRLRDIIMKQERAVARIYAEHLREPRS